jgi:hypothetical protein
VVSQANERPYVERALNRVYDGSRERVMSSIYRDTDEITSFRIHHIELGLPSVDGWREYRDSVDNDPPDAIVMDGVELIEIMFDQPDVAQQLKDMANRYSIPVVVNVPINRAIYEQDDIVHPRRDFNDLADIQIALSPRAVSVYKVDNREHGKYHFLELDIMTNPRDGDQYGYFIKSDIDFIEQYGEFI